MKRETAVSLILEARRQGHAEAQTVFEVAMKSVAAAVPSVEALQAEVERLTAENARLATKCDSLERTMAAVNEADAEALELGWLVRAMPVCCKLQRQSMNWYCINNKDHNSQKPGCVADTPIAALRAAGVGQEDEPCQK